MAVNYILSNPKFSFVQFLPVIPVVIPSIETIHYERDDYSCCPEPVDFALPVIAETDLKFQIKMITHDPELACDIIGNPVPSELLLLRGCGNNEDTITANTIANFTITYGLEFIVEITGENEVTFYWGERLRGLLSLIACDECFQLLFRFNVPGSEEIIQYVSRCFVRKCNPCFFSILEYSCEEDSYDFRYCQFPTIPTNRIRLPFYLLKAQLNTSREVYVRSDGSWDITQSITKKEFNALVDFVPESIHEKLAIALEHDIVNVESEKYTGGIRNNAAYSIDWIDGEECVAQGNFKANATPFDARNNNCQECDPPDPNICESVHACDVDVEDIEWQLIWFDGSTPINGHPRMVITYTNPSGSYPAAGYEVRRGKVVGGFTIWEAPIIVSFPDLTATFIHDMGDDGDFFIKITAICNNTTSHETIIPYNLSNPCACDEDLVITPEIIVNGDTSTTVNFSWPYPSCGMPIGGFSVASALAPGGIPGTWTAEGAIDDYVIADGICGFGLTTSPGTHGTFAKRITTYCGQGVTHQTIIIYTI